ncbi:MFS transporter [Acetatifactor aquisgranensis]|uniref:MFS transporter n=1 Tax=Acetatifactor aquisgranensis TaxID=2941233 RepID=UPI00203FCDB6|nr:MFS transporter [Acetatifactor aquisgranensis]
MSKKPTASELDGVQYRKAKLWQIILYACNGLVGMSVYSLINLASYSASIGYGVTTIAIGYILTCTRILDGVTDPLLAFVYDRVNTRFGKLRVLLIAGYLVEALGLLCMFVLFSSKGFGWIAFTLFYIVYVIGYTITNMTAQTIPAIMSNDPRQRPTIGVWTTAFNYLVPMIMMMVLNMVLLPRFGGEYNQSFLSAACMVCLVMAALGTVLVCIGVTEFDRPEYFAGLKKKEPLKLKDMAEVLAHNRPLQCYIASNASDKIAQQTASQAVITTLLFGIVIGNMGISTLLTVISMIPSILFAAVGAKYAGKHGSRKAIVTWTWISMGISLITLGFFIIIDTSQIAVMMSPAMILYVLLTLAQNGSNMCITTANTSFMADTIDYELDRSGRYVPAVVTGTYSLIDKIITAFSATVAAGAVAILGYTTTMPQPGETCTSAIFWVTMAVKFGLPVFGWICTLVAMRFCGLDKEEMVNVQKRIAEKKEQARHQVIMENLQ